jgi:hypothetical protein
VTTITDKADAETHAISTKLDLISQIDLGMIKMKLADHEEGKGWTPYYASRVETEYRRYLSLSWAYPDKAIVPSRDVDVFWHYHILDTQAYEVDCQEIFGYFLHHYPYFGMRGVEDAQALGDAYDDTLRRYEANFGPAPEDIWARTGIARCPNCGRKCRC